jgi:hypothetical protein
MPRVGFEPTILVFERAKTFHALGHCDRHQYIIMYRNCKISVEFPEVSKHPDYFRFFFAQIAATLSCLRLV